MIEPCVGESHLVVIEGGNAFVGCEPITDVQVRWSISHQILRGEAVFGDYLGADEYADEFLRHGFVVADVAGLERGEPEVLAKGGLMIGGMGKLALAKYEQELPPGVAHHEGYFTIPRAQGQGRQSRIIQAIESRTAWFRNISEKSVNDFTAAVDPIEEQSSTRNTFRNGHVAVAFDRNYLEPPLGVEDRLAALVTVKVAPSSLDLTGLRKQLVEFDPRTDKKDDFFDAIQAQLRGSNVAVNIEPLRDDSGAEVEGSSRLTFVSTTDLPPKAQDVIVHLQPQILERL